MRTKMRKQYNIPIFIPHVGCKNECTFCNQRKISGQTKMITEDELRQTIEEYLESFKEKKAYKEIAFFGGSFTGIDIEDQERLLKVANEYIKAKKINGIRISTRPDYIDKKILKMLKRYNVKSIELGVQSTNDYILNRCKRGHSFEDIKRASKLIRRYRFNLGHQMMIGLPDSTKLDEINTARHLIRLKPKMIRIYPVLVIKDTELEKEYLKGTYKPIPLAQAIETCKELVYMFDKKKIDIIRIGLQNTDNITDPQANGSDVIAGPYHPAFGQLVEDSIWYDCIVNKIKKISAKVKEVEIRVNKQDVCNVIGHKKSNILKLKEVYDVEAQVTGVDYLKPGQSEISVVDTYKN